MSEPPRKLLSRSVVDLHALSGTMLDYFVARMYHEEPDVRVSPSTGRCEVRRGENYVPFSPSRSPVDALSVVGDGSKIWDEAARERALRDCLRAHHRGNRVSYDVAAFHATLCIDCYEL